MATPCPGPSDFHTISRPSAALLLAGGTCCRGDLWEPKTLRNSFFKPCTEGRMDIRILPHYLPSRGPCVRGSQSVDHEHDDFLLAAQLLIKRHLLAVIKRNNYQFACQHVCITESPAWSVQSSGRRILKCFESLAIGNEPRDGWRVRSQGQRLFWM